MESRRGRVEGEWGGEGGVGQYTLAVENVLYATVRCQHYDPVNPQHEDPVPWE
jgi:hypothetical protein